MCRVIGAVSWPIIILVELSKETVLLLLQFQLSFCVDVYHSYELVVLVCDVRSDHM